MYDLVIRQGLVYSNRQFIQTNVYINQTKIALISDADYPAKVSHDASERLVLPGIIDPHVHFELDLGSIKSVDDFYHGSLAALYGGVTSFIDFLDPANSVKSLEENYHKRIKEAKKSLIDYTFHATFINPIDDIELMVKKVKDLGLTTIKVFTTYEDSGRKISDTALIRLLELSSQYHFTLLIHVEKDDLINLNPRFIPTDILKSRPTDSEIKEALNIARLVNQYGGNVYMVHTSSGLTIEKLKTNYPKLLNKQFYIESCPQYFTFDHGVFKDTDGYLYTFAPPLRETVSKEKLFEYINHIDTIGTDHCAFNKADKRHKRLIDTPLGIGSIEHSFNIMFKHFGDSIIPKMTENVAKIHNLLNKGCIQEGYDADIFIFEKDDSMRIKSNHGLCDYSIYYNQPGSGHVIDTLVRGQFVLKNRHLVPQQGHLIKRGIKDESNN